MQLSPSDDFNIGLYEIACDVISSLSELLVHGYGEYVWIEATVECEYQNYQKEAPWLSTKPGHNSIFLIER